MKSRRVFHFMAVVFLVSTTASAALATILAGVLGIEWDVTALREHALSDRTSRVLESLGGEHEIVIATEWSSLPRHVRDRVGESVERLADASDSVRATLIDTTSGEGQARYQVLFERLLARDALEVDTQLEGLAEGVSEVEEFAAALEQLASTLDGLARSLPVTDAELREGGASLSTLAQAARFRASQLREIASSVEQDLGASVDATTLGGIDRARGRVISTTDTLAEEFATLAGQVGQFAEWDRAPQEQRSIARSLVGSIDRRREQAASLGDSLRRLPRPDVMRISSVLSQDGAALVIGPPGRGVTAVDLGALFPASLNAGDDVAAVMLADLPRRTEELLGTALSALTSPDRPVVVLVHARPERFLAVPAFRGALERLQLRGIDLAEWRVLEDPGEPDLSAVDPSGARPRVYVAIGSDTVGGGEAGIERARALGATLDRLAERGESLLVSLVPSVLPTFGAPDPAVGFLDRFGVTARTGEMLLRSRQAAGERAVSTEHVAIPRDGEHALAQTIEGLSTVISWPVPINVADSEPGSGERVAQWPMLQASGADLWAEREWTAVWQTPPEQRHLLPSLPQPNEGLDDTAGPWTLGVAVERHAPGLVAPQRLVVVGSADWFFDRWTQEAELVDGVPRFKYPGNLELFESSVYWLAGLDDMVGASATARPVAVVKPLDASTITVLRWGVALGPPALVLLLGGAWRLRRG